MGNGVSVIINGVDFSEKLSGYKLGFADNNKVTQAADGTTHISHLRHKASLELTWAALTDDEIAGILDAVKYDGRNYIQYYDYTKPFNADKRCNASGFFYVEGRDAAIAFMDGNQIIWSDFTLKFSEH